MVDSYIDSLKEEFSFIKRLDFNFINHTKKHMDDNELHEHIEMNDQEFEKEIRVVRAKMAVIVEKIELKIRDNAEVFINNMKTVKDLPEYMEKLVGCIMDLSDDFPPINNKIVPSSVGCVFWQEAVYFLCLNCMKNFSAILIRGALEGRKLKKNKTH